MSSYCRKRVSFANMLEATVQMAVGNPSGPFGAEFGINLMNSFYHIQVASSVRETHCETLTDRGLFPWDTRNVAGNVMPRTGTS